MQVLPHCGKRDSDFDTVGYKAVPPRTSHRTERLTFDADQSWIFSSFGRREIGARQEHSLLVDREQATRHFNHRGGLTVGKLDRHAAWIVLFNTLDACDPRV